MNIFTGLSTMLLIARIYAVIFNISTFPNLKNVFINLIKTNMSYYYVCWGLRINHETIKCFFFFFFFNLKKGIIAFFSTEAKLCALIGINVKIRFGVSAKVFVNWKNSKFYVFMTITTFHKSIANIGNRFFL